MFEIALLAMVLASLATAITALASVRGRRFGRARHVVARYGTGLAVYVAILVAVPLATPQRLIPIGADWCFDDWCVAVEEATRAQAVGEGVPPESSTGVFYIVTLRLSNHPRGREQRVSSAAVRLLDRDGKVYEVPSRGQVAFEAANAPTEPLTVTIPVGGSVRTVRVFEVPRDVVDLGLTVVRPLGFAPGWFIIGDQASVLHRPTVIRLP